MKKELLILLLVIAMAPLVQVRFSDEYIKQGSEFEVHARVINELKSDMDNIRIRAVIPELGVMFTTGNFDVEDKSSESRFLHWDTKGYPKGDYLIKIVTSNEDFANVKYRYLTIY